uniref:Glutamate rich 2 n=1 Tax=Macaca fascicularis TaxID=9541 RepID=A0A7N9CFU4_MACFA
NSVTEKLPTLFCDPSSYLNTNTSHWLAWQSSSSGARGNLGCSRCGKSWVSGSNHLNLTSGKTGVQGLPPETHNLLGATSGWGTKSCRGHLFIHNQGHPSLPTRDFFLLPKFKTLRPPRPLPCPSLRIRYEHRHSNPLSFFGALEGNRCACARQSEGVCAQFPAPRDTHDRGLSLSPAARPAPPPGPASQPSPAPALAPPAPSRALHRPPAWARLHPASPWLPGLPPPPPPPPPLPAVAPSPSPHPRLLPELPPHAVQSPRRRGVPDSEPRAQREQLAGLALGVCPSDGRLERAASWKEVPSKNIENKVSLKNIENRVSSRSIESKDILTNLQSDLLSSSCLKESTGEVSKDAVTVKQEKNNEYCLQDIDDKLSESAEDDDDDDTNDEDNDEDSNPKKNTQAPLELMAEFLRAEMAREYQLAKKLCQMILIYEPENPEAKEFFTLIEEMLLMEKTQNREQDGEDSDEDSSGESKGESDEELSDESSDEGEDGS